MVLDGYKIPFSLSLSPARHWQQIVRSVLDLLAKAVVVEVTDRHHSQSFFNSLFLVPKSDRMQRPIYCLLIPDFPVSRRHIRHNVSR